MSTPRKVIVISRCTFALAILLFFVGKLNAQDSTTNSISGFETSVTNLVVDLNERDPAIQFEIAQAYRTGNGLPKDFEKAIFWYWKAAEQDNKHAQFYLGDAYTTGQGVKTDFAEAERWFRKAALNGEVVSQLTLGNMYYRARFGAKTNFDEAAKWYRMVVNNSGSGVAKRFVQQANKALSEIESTKPKADGRPLTIAEIDKPDKNGMTLLMVFAYAGDAGSVKNLITQGASIFAKCRDNQMTALHYAAHKGQVQAIEVLLKAGASVDSKDTNGSTPLFWAAKAETRSAEAVASLLAGGADATVTDKWGNIAQQHATKAGNTETAKILSEAAPATNPLNRRLQQNFAKFPFIALKTRSKEDLRPAWHAITVTNPVVIEGVRYGGFRFRVDRSAGEDFVWASVNENLSNWFLIPEFGNAQAFCEYGTFLKSSTGESVSIQPLLGERLMDGKTYLLWFTFVEGKPAEIKFAYTFKKLERLQDVPNESKALSLGHRHFVTESLQDAIGAVNTFEEVGMALGRDEKTGNICVVDTIEYGCPAYKAEIFKGDVLVSINGIPVTDKTVDQVKEMMKGLGEITVKAHRSGSSYVRTCLVKRKTIRVLQTNLD